MLLVAVLAVLASPGPACRDGDPGGSASGGTTTTATSPLLLATDVPVSVLSTLPLPPDHELAGAREVELEPVVGKRPPGPPVTAVAMAGGSSRIRGILRGPEGPVGGATVRVERFVGDQVGRLDLVARDDGSFEAAGLPGGRYRIRGWSRPSLTVTRPVLTFVAADQGPVDVELELELHRATTMVGAVGVSRWQVGQQAAVSVLVSQEYVDDEGIVRTAGIGGALINLRVPAGLSVLDSPSVTTGRDGYARFTVGCGTPGRYRLVAESSGFEREILAPWCAPLPPPPSSTGTTGTAAAGSFDTPSPGPYPAGTYTSTNPDAAARCVTLYEVEAGGQWRPDTATAVIRASGAIREIRPAPGSPPCTYRRSS